MGVIRRQSIVNTLTGYLGIVIAFISLLIVQPNLLTPEEIGLTKILYNFSLLIATFVPMGIGNATTRFFPAFKDKEKNNHGYFAFMNLFPIAGFLIATILIFLLRNFILNQYRTNSPLFLEFFNYIFPLIFFNSFIFVLSIYCNSNYKSTVPSFLNDVVVRILVIVVVILYYFKLLNFDQFVFSFVAVYGIQLIALIGYIYQFDKPKLKIDWQAFRERKFFSLIKFGLLVWFAGIAAIGLKYTDSIMIGKFLTLDYVGIYAIAALIPTVIEAPLNALDRIAAAKISFAWKEGDTNTIYTIYHKSSLYMFLIGGFAFLLINANIHSLLSFLKPEYQNGELVVLILSIGTLFNMATGLNAPILFNSDKYRYGAVYLILLAGLIVVLQMIFIPLYGIYGAALATCATSLIYNFIMFITVNKFFKLQPFDRKNLKVLFVIIAIFLSVFWLPNFSNAYLDILIRTMAVSFTYPLLIYFLNVAPEFHKYLPWEKSKYKS